MIVRLFATLRNIARAREVILPAPRDIESLLNIFSERYGESFDREIWLNRSGDRQKLIPGVIILVNGRHYAHLEGLLTPLVEEDIVSLFPPLAGG